MARQGMASQFRRWRYAPLVGGVAVLGVLGTGAWVAANNLSEEQVVEAELEARSMSGELDPVVKEWFLSQIGPTTLDDEIAALDEQIAELEANLDEPVDPELAPDPEATVPDPVITESQAELVNEYVQAMSELTARWAPLEPTYQEASAPERAEIVADFLVENEQLALEAMTAESAANEGLGK